ncbi:MAG: response regulator [Cyanobacteria bacterium J06600_6]
MRAEILLPLLIVEDSDADFCTLTRMLKKANLTRAIYRCEDGEEALDFLLHQEEYQDRSLAPRPALIILDLNLPGTDGREVLIELKQNPDLQSIPVVIFSTSDNPRDVAECYRCGVSSYISKPMNMELLNQLAETFVQYWLDTVQLPVSSHAN